MNLKWVVLESQLQYTRHNASLSTLSAPLNFGISIFNLAQVVKMSGNSKHFNV